MRIKPRMRYCICGMGNHLRRTHCHACGKSLENRPVY